MKVGGHQGVPIELAPPELQPLPRRPGGEDGPQRRDHFGHPRHRPVEVGAEPLLDLGADLSAEPQGEPAAGQDLMVDGLVRQVNRIARECDRHIGHQVQAPTVDANVSGVKTSCGPSKLNTPTGPGIAQRPRTVGSIGRPVQRRHDLHSGSP